jgi:hypothetical protein
MAFIICFLQIEVSIHVIIFTIVNVLSPQQIRSIILIFITRRLLNEFVRSYSKICNEPNIFL